MTATVTPATSSTAAVLRLGTLGPARAASVLWADTGRDQALHLLSRLRHPQAHAALWSATEWPFVEHDLHI